MLCHILLFTIIPAFMDFAHYNTLSSVLTDSGYLLYFQSCFAGRQGTLFLTYFSGTVDFSCFHRTFRNFSFSIHSWCVLICTLNLYCQTKLCLLKRTKTSLLPLKSVICSWYCHRLFLHHSCRWVTCRGATSFTPPAAVVTITCVIWRLDMIVSNLWPACCSQVHWFGDGGGGGNFCCGIFVCEREQLQGVTIGVCPVVFLGELWQQVLMLPRF